MYIQASDDLISVFFSKVGDIVSGKGGIVEASHEQRKLFVVYKDGAFLCDENFINKPLTHAFRELCLRKGIRITKCYSVDMNVIRLLYNELGDLNDARESQQPMEMMASELLESASIQQVSDIHIKINKHEAEVLFRRNGEMEKVKTINSDVAHSLVSSLYNAAESADATYRIYDYQAARVAQGGSLCLPKNVQSVRLQYNPLPNGGRYLIARMLYAENKWGSKLTLEKLGFHTKQIEAIEKLKNKPEGVSFVAGPTGSGKSTTLKVILESIYHERDKKVNIISIEDPPEYEIVGAAQLPVTNVESEEERKIAYSKAIVAALRSDPDIIMPGEARDSAVISLVFTAAMTGHQVWTSIHANSAVGVFDRLKDQGVEDYKLRDSDLVCGVISQRLVKKICPHCSIKYDDLSSKVNLPPVFDGVIDKLKFNNKKGCKYCSSGYCGRSVVAEVLTTDDYFLKFLVNGDRKEAIEYWKKELGGITIKEHGWLKAVNGEVDPLDVTSRLGGIERFER